MQKNNSLTTQKLALIALMAALVYVCSAFLQIPITTIIDNSRIHMGNVMCLLSGILLGPVYGGLAAGIGSMLFDLTNPAYIATAPLTFIFKFVMAFIAGKIDERNEDKKKTIVACLCGSISYTILYLSKNFIEHYFILNGQLETVLIMVGQKAIISITNGIIAMIVASLLAFALKPILRKIQK